MTDTVKKHVRSQIMSKVKNKNTSLELMVRKMLFKSGFRYRLHGDLPGKPDMVFPKYNAVIFIHGCFWHGHGCGRTHIPNDNSSYWTEKIKKNINRDASNKHRLLSMEWRVMEIWECALTGKKRLNTEELSATLANWLTGTEQYREVRALG